MWELLDSDDPGYQDHLKRCAARHPDETEEALARLKELHGCLQEGMPLPAALQRGWVHHRYKRGMKSIDGGGGKGKAGVRLYIFPDPKRKVLLVLEIGDKSRQDRDIKQAYAVLDAYEKEVGDDEIQTP